ncbi:MAG: formyl transferase [Candidatus Rokubacteria bacterium]|nr:formyl transferase [Candidatus Rokubacteria bacterium]
MIPGGRMVRRIFRERTWSIGVVREPIHVFLQPGYRPQIHFVDLPLRGRYFADPFGIVHGTTLTVLCETFEYRTWQGTIVAFRVDALGAASAPVEVMANDHHLSYPFLVEDGGVVYCVPEQAEAREVVLYAAAREREFPGTWTKAATLLTDVAALDATLFRHAGLWWLAYTDAALGMSDNLCLSYAETLHGPWRPHARNPVKRDARSSRPGGTPFAHDGGLYRPAQDGSTTYGGRIAINRVTDLTPTTFAEEPVIAVDPDPDGPFPTGLHTLSAAGPFTLLDGRRDVLTAPRVGAAIAKFRRARQRRRAATTGPGPASPGPGQP